jgi:hypothetical protein
MVVAAGGCQSGSKVIPGYSKIDRPSGLTAVRFIARGIE